MKSIIIYSFMIKDLKLQGSELIIYALIYSFCQFGQSCFMRPDKMAIELGLSRSQVFRSIKSLLAKGFIFSAFDGLYIHKREDTDFDSRVELERLIKICKTPWLND